jgi:hypothetical protein
MRVLRFIGRWLLIYAAMFWISFGPLPATTATVLLFMLVANNCRHRRRVRQLEDLLRAGRTVWVAPPPGGRPPTTAAPPTSGGSGGGPGHARMVAGLLVGSIALGVLGGPFGRRAVAAGPFDHSGPVEATSTSADVLAGPIGWNWGQLIGDRARQAATGAIRSMLRAAEAAFVTPEVAELDRVKELWRVLATIGNSLLLVLLVVGAVMVVAGDWSYLEAKELAPRLIFAGIAMNLSLVVLAEAVDASNLVVKGILAIQPDSLTVSAERLFQGASPLVLIPLLAGALFLLATNLIRIVVVIFLAVAGPLLHAFGVLPATDGVARGWWRALAVVLIAPCIQALLLVIGVWIFVSGSGAVMVPSADGSGLIDGIMFTIVVALMGIAPVWMFVRLLGGSARHVRNAGRMGRRLAKAAVL